MDYLSLLQRNLLLALDSSYRSGLPDVYVRAEAIAKATFSANHAYFRGTIRYGLSEDLFEGSARAAGCHVKRVFSQNTMSHVEVYTPECIFIQGKSDSPGSPRTAAFIQRLLGVDRQPDFFEGVADKAERMAGDDRIVVQLTHTPDADDPSIVAYITAVVMGSDGEVAAYFPMESIHGRKGGEEGVEVVPDNVITPPKAGGATGTAK